MAADGIAPDEYLPRVVDEEMQRALSTMPAVLVEGPRACGKTWTGRQFAKSAVYLDHRVSAALEAGMDPASILEGEAPRLLDEWQLAPGVWNPMRRACDHRGVRGQFILTGSADPPDDITRHSGAGRTMRVRMRPMSLYESGESDGGVSLGQLLEGGDCAASDAGRSLGEVLELACRGGWPQLLDADSATAGDAARAYLQEISRTDISRVDGTERDPVRVQRLIVSLARNVATEARRTVLPQTRQPRAMLPWSAAQLPAIWRRCRGYSCWRRCRPGGPTSPLGPRRAGVRRSSRPIHPSLRLHWRSKSMDCCTTWLSQADCSSRW